MKVLVIDGAGSPAARAFRQSLAENDAARTVVLSTTDITPLRSEQILRVDDCFAPPPEAFAGVDSIVNLAGDTRAATDAALWRLNSQGPVALAKAALAAGVRHFVQLSSFSIFGDAEDIGPDAPLAPRSLYGRTKLAAEEELGALRGAGLELALVRAPMIYGPDGGDKLSQLASLVCRLGFLPAPPQRQPRSTVHVANLALGLMQLAEQHARGSFFVCDPEPFVLDRLPEVIFAVRQQRVRLLELPSFTFGALQVGAAPLYRSLYARSLLRAGEALPLPATAVPLAVALRDVVPPRPA